jgi:hypothetical protein
MHAEEGEREGETRKKAAYGCSPRCAMPDQVASRFSQVLQNVVILQACASRPRAR